MDTSSSLQDLSTRKDVVNIKYRFGITFGVIVGLAFAVATWGADAITLYSVHAYQPWLKLIVGALICMPVGGLTGWLSARSDKTVISVLLWLVAAAIFAWLSTMNTFYFFPALVVKINPSLASFVNYSVDQNYAPRTDLAFVWTGIFGMLIGVLQLPLSEGAVFSASFGSKLFTVGLVVVIMGVCGVIVDNLNNEPLRLPVLSLQRTIDFAVETQGQEVDPKLARTMRRYAVRDIEDWLEQPYYLVVGSFDREFGQVHVFANFANNWADCIVVYNQPSNCDPLSP